MLVEPWTGKLALPNAPVALPHSTAWRRRAALPPGGLPAIEAGAGYFDVSGAVFRSRPPDHRCHVRTDEATTTAPKA